MLNYWSGVRATEKQKNKTRISAKFICLLTMFVSLLAVLAIDLWLLRVWNQGQASFQLIYFEHILSSSLFLFHGGFCWLMGQSWRFSVLNFLMVLALGPLGVAGMLLTAMLYIRYRQTATPFETWYKQILPEQITPPEEMLIERLRIWSQESEDQHRELVPFTDILISGSIKEKETAIDLMVRNYHPIFARALRAALKDSCNAVRAHAVAAITKIEEMFLAETFLLERRKVHHPSDYDNLLALARHYDEHANSGLGDTDILLEHRHKAEKLYRYLHSERPEDAGILWELGRLLVRDNRMSEACDIFETALKISADVVEPMQRIWHWECLYDLRRFGQLREEIQRCPKPLSRKYDLPASLVESIDLWMNNDIKAGVQSE